MPLTEKKVTDIYSIYSSNSTELLKTWRVFVPAGKRNLQKHSHIRFEITCVESGSGIYTVSERQYEMRSGDIFIFASNEQHCITDVSDGGLVISNIHFEPRYLWGSFTDSLSEKNINMCFSRSESFENRIPADRCAFIRSLFKEITLELAEKKPEYALAVKSLLNTFLIHLIRDFDYSEKSVPLSRDSLHSIRRVTNYIDANLCEKLTLEMLAEHAGMSPNYLSSFFHKISGITLWDYINSKRIDMAIRKLSDEDSNENILDIAYSCGFNNTANFNKAFKKATGMTPTMYRSSGDIQI